MSFFICLASCRLSSCSMTMKPAWSGLTGWSKDDIIQRHIRYRNSPTVPRTLINLEVDDKQWLDAEAKARGVSMAALVREAVHEYRVHEEATGRPALAQALADTAGIWRSGDGLAWQRRLRDEWTRDE